MINACQLIYLWGKKVSKNEKKNQEKTKIDKTNMYKIVEIVIIVIYTI